MGRSTKLFQQPGSPLIQGHSKTERSTIGEWVRATGAAWIVGVGVYIYLGLDPKTPFDLSDVWNAIGSASVRFLPGAILGAALGVPLARGFGWRRQWQMAALFGLAFGLVSSALLGGL